MLNEKKLDKLGNTFLAFLKTPAKNLPDFLKTHPVLMDKEALRLVSAHYYQEIKGKIEREFEINIEARIRFLASCQAKGIAYTSRQFSAAEDIPPQTKVEELFTMTEELFNHATFAMDFFDATGDQEALEAAIIAWEELIASPLFADLSDEE